MILAAGLMTAWGALVGAAASFFYARGMAYPLPVSVLLAVRGFCLAGAASAAAPSSGSPSPSFCWSS